MLGNGKPTQKQQLCEVQGQIKLTATGESKNKNDYPLYCSGGGINLKASQ